MDEPTEAQKQFRDDRGSTYEVGQYTRMGMWYVRRTTVETVALAVDRAKAIAIQQAFEATKP